MSTINQKKCEPAFSKHALWRCKVRRIPQEAIIMAVNHGHPDTTSKGDPRFCITLQTTQKKSGKQTSECVCAIIKNNVIITCYRRHGCQEVRQ